ncbi:hypothetical protein AJ79_08751 [Helicocarpus griseus UAMH5409]|uniref:Uncharacterized protein n=1 Tax=Helicocarpus griseus UAMH5409 TaxID=1447875 RepID=A0A2B7WQ31_9EURO|nr:hypothetical protein AJ79_08751 [Helicocarpus griseus UAMH5409]
MAPGSTYMTIGFLGRALSLGAENQPLPDFAFVAWARNVTIKAFRLSISLEKRTPEQQTGLLAWISDLVCDGLLKLPALECIRWDVDDKELGEKLKREISKAHKAELRQKKQVFVFEE